MSKKRHYEPRPNKFTITIPIRKWELFNGWVEDSGMSRNGYVNERIFRCNRHNHAELRLLGKNLAALAELTTELRSQNLMDDDMLREVMLSRTVIMLRMGRRS